jgi:hypothetical protein
MEAKTLHDIGRQKEMDEYLRPGMQAQSIEDQKRLEFLQQPLDVGDFLLDVYGKEPGSQTLGQSIGNGWLLDAMKMGGVELKGRNLYRKRDGSVITGADKENYMPFLKAVFNAKMDPGHAGNEKYDKLTEASKRGRLAPEQEQWMKQWEANKAEWLKAAYEKQIEQNARAKDYLKTKFNITDTSVLDYSTNRAIRKIGEINATNAERSKRQHEFDLERMKQRGRVALEGVKQKGKEPTTDKAAKELGKTSMDAMGLHAKELGYSTMQQWEADQASDYKTYSRLNSLLTQAAPDKYRNKPTVLMSDSVDLKEGAEVYAIQKMGGVKEADIEDPTELAEYETLKARWFDDYITQTLGGRPDPVLYSGSIIEEDGKRYKAIGGEWVELKSYTEPSREGR